MKKILILLLLCAASLSLQAQSKFNFINISSVDPENREEAIEMVTETLGAPTETKDNIYTWKKKESNTKYTVRIKNKTFKVAYKGRNEEEKEVLKKLSERIDALDKE